MITLTGRSGSSGFTFPKGMRSNPSSIANNPNYNPSIFGQGTPRDAFGLGQIESMQRRAREQKATEEAKLGGFIPPRARTTQPGSSDFSDVLNAMGYARGGKVVRQADGSLKSFNPVRLGGRDYYQEYMDRQSRRPYEAAAPSDPNKDFRRGYDRFIGSLMVDGGLDDSDKMSIRNYLSRAVLGGQINPYFARQLGSKSQIGTLNQDQKQLTDTQQFNLDTFRRAAPGISFLNNAGFGVVRSNSLFGKTSNMQPPVNLSLIGA